MRRRGLSVALIGADGSGKTTLARHLSHKLPGATLYLYFGINPEASETLLPTTRFVRAMRRARGVAAARGGPRQFRSTASLERERPWFSAASLALARRWVRLLNQLFEEWYRQVCERRARSRGAIVILDRHFFFDYYAHDMTDRFGRRSLLRRLHGWFLSLLSLPDLVILLDAPPHVLYERKPEGRPADVARRREEYIEISEAFSLVRRVDAARALEEVEADVIRLISNEISRRNRDHA